MANARRSRENFVGGTITDAPLAFDATNFSSGELIGLSEIDSAEHAAVILDPLGEGNGPEIVWVTAHTAGATDADIVRGKEGTTAVEHAVDTKWVTGPTAWDFGLVLASSADLPAAGFVGMRALLLDTMRTVEWNGYRWDRPWSQAWGMLDQNHLTSGPAIGAFIDNETVILTTNAVNVPAGRRIRVKADALVSVSSVSDTQASPVLRLRRGTSVSGTLLYERRFHMKGTSLAQSMDIEIEDEPAANASLRYVLTLTSPFELAAADAPWSWIVEDLGPRTTPSA